jgi:hypothetical protein
VCSQLLEAASIFEVCDLSCIELLERLERVERAGPSFDLVEYFHTFADDFLFDSHLSHAYMHIHYFFNEVNDYLLHSKKFIRMES